MEDVKYNVDCSDSDDELLGIVRNNPKISSLKGNNIFPRKNREHNYKSFESSNDKGLISTTPTMEIISGPYLKYPVKYNRYQKLPEVYGVVGFIVNIHDATNFDIDLQIPPEFKERYKDVISNQYKYVDLEDKFMEINKLEMVNKLESCIGTTYRCRLRGIGINQMFHNGYLWKSNQITVNIKKLIDRTDGWVTCNLSDIDVYHRLLVDININVDKKNINFKDYLLTQMDGQENPIFYSYLAKKGTYNCNTLKES